ncbi:MAG: phytanoyl-CoA dioxygenase family protein [Arenicellales bacterium]|jgi:ectoine hydroxylase-related dioxygenase (phytanoyl-CoA dioxygenase family)|nr:phytanoyl-CoA dioxygenase family protein [Arenicellales bacterium]|tara:strand:- start:896 stop:1696 length:801 start_codon:yes stop_codon:yes gene_type:complete
MLTTSEIESYREDGLVIPRNFRLSETELECLRGAVDSVISTNPDTPTDFLFNVHLDQAPPLRLVGHSAFSTLATDDKILDMVEQLIGPDIINWATHLFCKQATTGRAVPWHQDGQYWPIRPLRTCTAWVAIDRTTRANGALRYIPGSHKAGIYSHRTDNSPDLTLHQVIDDPRFEEDKARYAELEPGQISLHDVHLLHGSAANQSGDRRAGFAIRYMPSTSVLRRDLDMSPISKLDWTQIPLLLVRGQNRHADNDLEIGHRSGSVG